MKKKTIYPYDYEQAFKNELNRMETLFVEEMIKNRLNLHYAAKTVRAGRLVEVEIYPLFHHREDVPKTKKDNRKAQNNLNDKNARKKFIRLVNANFDKNDLWLTLTYENGWLPGSVQEAEHKVKNYIDRINYRRKKVSFPNARYIYITEWEDGEKGIRCHHHLFMDNLLDRNLLEKMWKFSERNESQQLVPDENGLTGLASYLSKDPKGKKRWKGSRNLKKPVETVNHTKVTKKAVEKMARDYEEIRTFFENDREWKKYQFMDAKVMYNNFNAAFYIHIMAREKERYQR